MRELVCQLVSSVRSFRADKNARVHTDVSQSGIAENNWALSFHRKLVDSYTPHLAWGHRLPRDT